ncbi:MAG: hemolysin III family protein [Spirochaetales bacterium]|nr:hemolysin III family protein [Candidatus Physcosoma equi]
MPQNFIQTNVFLSQQKKPVKEGTEFHAKDPMSALTHFIGFLMAIVATPLLLVKAASNGKPSMDLMGLAVFALSMIFLYGASASYHAFILSTERRNMVLKKMDHMMISILVAGTYTPLCMTVLKDNGGMVLLTIVWSLAVSAILFKAFWVTCPKWVSSIIYLLMGWAVAPYMGTVYRLFPHTAFGLLLAGGIAYTIGAIVYVFRIPPRSYKGFGSHEVFHLFVMLGTILHFLMIYNYIA